MNLEKIEKKEMTFFPPNHRKKDKKRPIIFITTLYKTMSPQILC